MPLPTMRDLIADQVMTMTCDEQFALAQRIAANVGYKLVPEGNDPDRDIEARVDRLEDAMHDLNPGWMP